MNTLWLTIILIAVPVLILAGLYIYFVHSSISLWFRAFIADAHVSLFDIAFLRLEKVKPDEIEELVNLIIQASKGGIYIETAQLGAHLLAGGDVHKVIRAMIEAGQAGIPLDLKRACAIDLAGRDVLDAVQMSISPRVLKTPEISSVAKDGIQMLAKCSVTVRANLDLFLGGAGEETILARVGTGIVSAIGSTEKHYELQANPSLISEHIWNIDKDEDNVSDIHQDAAFEVISIDVADVNVGKNINAALQTQRAEADAKLAEALAEQKRAEAVTLEEEMKARVYEMQAKRLEAEAQVPLAIAEAIETGTLKVKNYFKIKNLNADTRMREAFSMMGKPPVDDKE